MKHKLIYLLSFFCLLVAGCNDDDDPVMVLSQTEFNEISHEGGICKIDITSNYEWTATSDNDWCKVSKQEGVANYTLAVEVEANLGEARTGKVTITAQGTSYTVTISQQGLTE